MLTEFKKLFYFLFWAKIEKLILYSQSAFVMCGKFTKIIGYLFLLYMEIFYIFSFFLN